jgi:regulatory protein
MIHHATQGKSDATIIPFPLHRVSPVDTDAENDAPAPVKAMPGLDSAEVPRVERTVTEGEPHASPKLERRAHNVSLHALAGRDMSRAEVVAKLRQRELPAEVIEAEVEALVLAGLIDDDALALDLVDRYANRRGMAKPVVAQKLRQRNLDHGSLQRALAELDEDTEISKLDEIARDRLRKMGDLDPVTTKRRLAGYLQRKGFSSSEVFSTLDRVLNSH